jgi:organic hydroperoxide reductase OsmC/OhrA
LACRGHLPTISKSRDLKPSTDLVLVDGEVSKKETAARVVETAALAARLNVILPGVEREVAQSLVEAAHQLCPYSNATRGNIEVAINVV